MSATRVVEVARSQLGTVEKPANSNRTKYGKWYGMDGNAWCAMFTDWVFEEAGVGALHPKSAYTPAIWDWFSKRGRTGMKPVVGALVLFDFPNDGVNRISHIGIVEKVNSDGSIVSIEGNTSPGVVGSQRDGGGVYRRTRRVGIVGYAYPAYVPVPATIAAPALATLVEGNGNVSLNKYLQTKLNAKYGAKLVVDGDFGPATKKAVIKVQQKLGLDPDGVVGPVTWSKL